MLTLGNLAIHMYTHHIHDKAAITWKTVMLFLQLYRNAENILVSESETETNYYYHHHFLTPLHSCGVYFTSL